MCVTMWGFAVGVDDRRIDCTADSLRNQLVGYEREERRGFDVDMRFPDSFADNMVRVMASIPYGETRTYGEVTAKLDSHAVAVGQTYGRNPIPLVVLCHRVVGTDSLGGFSMAGDVDLKRALLNRERDAVQTGLDRLD